MRIPDQSYDGFYPGPAEPVSAGSLQKASEFDAQLQQHAKLSTPASKPGPDQEITAALKHFRNWLSEMFKDHRPELEVYLGDDVKALHNLETDKYWMTNAEYNSKYRQIIVKVGIVMDSILRKDFNTEDSWKHANEVEMAHSKEEIGARKSKER